LGRRGRECISEVAGVADGYTSKCVQRDPVKLKLWIAPPSIPPMSCG